MIEENKEKERSQKALKAFRQTKMFFLILFIFSAIGIIGGMLMALDPHKVEIIGTNSKEVFNTKTKISKMENRIHGIIAIFFSTLLAYVSCFFFRKSYQSIKAEEEFLIKLNHNEGRFM